MAQAAKPEVANTTFGAPVYRGDGLRLYGLDAELELKAQEKRDPELESSLEKWIEEVIGETLEPKSNLQKSLKSGVVLCKMMNKLYPGSIKTINMKPIGMMEMENIGFYLKSCWNLGIPSAELFVTSDLYNNKHFQAVLDNLLSVARVAHAQDDYSGPVLAAVAVPSAEAKKRGKSKKHREVNPQPAGLWNEQTPETPETMLKRQLEEQAEAHVRLQQELERVQGLLAKEKYKREELQGQLSKAVSRDARKSRLLHDAAKALEPTVSVVAADAKLAEVKSKLASELEEERREKSQLQVELQRLQERAHRKSMLLRNTQSEQEELKAMLKKEEELAQVKRKTEVASLESDLTRLKAQLSEMQDKCTRLAQSETQLKSQVRLLEQENTGRAERTQQLEEETIKLERMRMEKEAEAAEAGREVLRVRDELSKAQKSVQSMDSQAQTEVASKAAEVNELLSRVAHFRSQLEEAAVRLSTSNKEKAALSAELEAMRAEVKKRDAAVAAEAGKGAELQRRLASSQAEVEGLRAELELLRKGESSEAAAASQARAAHGEAERRAQMLASQLASLQDELQRETEAAAMRAKEQEEQANADSARQEAEIEALRELLNKQKEQEDESAQQLDDFKRRAAARVKAADEEVKALRAQLLQREESETASKKALEGELAALRLRQAQQVEDSAKQKVVLTRQVADETRLRAALAAELEDANAKLATLKSAMLATAKSAPMPTRTPAASTYTPSSASSAPMRTPVASSYTPSTSPSPSPSTSRIAAAPAPPVPTVVVAPSPTPKPAASGVTRFESPSPRAAGGEGLSARDRTNTSLTTNTSPRRDGRELKKTKSEKKIRTTDASPGDAVAALGRAALSQSAVMAQTQPKPELQRQRTALLRSEATKRADEDATKESDVLDKLRKRDEKRLREGVTALLKGEDIDLHGIKRMYGICSSDVGRRGFIKQLKSTMKETKNLVLPSQSFEVLVYLYNYCIHAMQTANKVDFRACMIFMYTAQALCHKTPDGATEYLATHIRSHTVWHSVVFWEEYFWAELRKKYDEQNKELGDTVDSDTFANLFCPLILSSFTHDMILTWDVPVQTATEFITDMVAANALSKKHYDALLSELRDYVAARQNAALKQQADDNLRKRHRATQQLSGGGGGGGRRPGVGEEMVGDDDGLMIGTAAKWNRASRMVQLSRQ